MPVFVQCEAIKPNGERCQRQAQTGSRFCYSHRTRPHGRLNPKDKLADLDLWISRKACLIRCDVCGHLRRDVTRITMVDTIVVVCPRCVGLIDQIKMHVCEFCAVAGGRGADAIHEEMEKFGIDAELTEKIRLWMLSTGELVYCRRPDRP